jgi:hypothetical protein
MSADDLKVTVFSGAVLVAIIAFTIYANIWNWRRRSKMTPEERAADRELHRRIPGDW